MGIIKVNGDDLYQWDLGRSVKVPHLKNYTVDEVHFMNPNGATAFVVDPVDENGEVVFPIPNILLQAAINIRAFAVTHTVTGDRTIAECTFGVSPRQKPSDYVYTETEVRTYEALEERIKALEENRVPNDTVLFVAQSLTPDQQEQARKNIGAAAGDKIPDSLPNPEKLTVTGGVTGEYDGSRAMHLLLPQVQQINLFDRQSERNVMDYQIGAAGMEYTVYDDGTGRSYYGVTHPIYLEAGVSYQLPHSNMSGGNYRCAKVDADGSFLESMLTTAWSDSEGVQFERFAPTESGWYAFNYHPYRTGQVHNVACMVCREDRFPTKKDENGVLVYVPYERFLMDKINAENIVGDIPSVAALKEQMSSLIVPDYTGFSSFDKFGTVGDSLTVGSQNLSTGEGGADKDHSWAKFISRHCGNEWLSLGFAGATTTSWIESTRADAGLTFALKDENKCSAYIIGLGYNDCNATSSSGGVALGSMADIDVDNEDNNAVSYYGNLDKLLRKIHTKFPDAPLFLLTNPYLNIPETTAGYNTAVRAVASRLGTANNVHLIDLYELYNDIYIQLAADREDNHYHTYVYAYMGMLIATAISGYMKDNLTHFRYLNEGVTLTPTEPLTVKLTDSDGTYTADKTHAEILAAYNAGQVVRCAYGAMVLPLVRVHATHCAFACVYSTSLYSVLIKASDNSITMTVTDLSSGGTTDLSGYISAPATAAVGQTVVVKAVDETGKPTEWEAADLPAGGSGSGSDNPMELIRTVTIPADITTDTSGVIWSQSTTDATKPYKFEVDIEPLKYLMIIYKGGSEGSAAAGSQASTKLIGDAEYQTLTTAFTASTLHGRAALFVWDGYTVLQTGQGTTWGDLNWIAPRVDNSIPATVGLTQVSKIAVWNWNSDACWTEGTTFEIYGVRA